MTIHDIINLVGLKSTDPKLLQFFEIHGIGKPPESLMELGFSESVEDKQHRLEFNFETEIINDQFYPPTCLYYNEYYDADYYACYLECVWLFSETSAPDPKPPAFWEGFINPQSSYEACMAFFSNAKERANTRSVCIYKPLNDIVEMMICFTPDRSRITDMLLRIASAREIFSHCYFDTNYTTIKQAYALLVKWLFDNRYLLLPEQAYNETLSWDAAAIFDFTARYLNNHIWDTQLADKCPLIHFLDTIRADRDDIITTAQGEKVNMYIRYLYIKASGKWEQYQKLDGWEAVEHFENSIRLDEMQSKAFLQSLTDMYEIFRHAPRENWYLVYR